MDSHLYQNHVTFNFRTSPPKKIDTLRLSDNLRQKIPQIVSINFHRQHYLIITIRLKLDENLYVGEVWRDIRKCLKENGLKIIYNEKDDT